MGQWGGGVVPESPGRVVELSGAWVRVVVASTTGGSTAAPTSAVVVVGGTTPTPSEETALMLTVEGLNVGPQEVEGVGGEVGLLDDTVVHDSLAMNAGGEDGDGGEVRHGETLVLVSDPEVPDRIASTHGGGVAEVESDDVRQPGPEVSFIL